jgi:hypothetical protein
VHRAIETEDGRTLNGYAVYNLYHGNGTKLPIDRSYLEQDWPLDFTRGSHVDDVAVIVPSPEMQRRLLTVIESPTYGRCTTRPTRWWPTRSRPSTRTATPSC